MDEEGLSEEQAHKKCYSIMHQSSSSIKQEGDRLFIEAFLLDASVNLNDWGVSQATLDENINTFIGKPLVLTEDFNHPDIDDGNLNHVFANQEPYRVGTIVEIKKKDSKYYGLIEVTDGAAKQAIQTAKLPPFVSPAIYPIGAQPQPDQDLVNWVGVHLAIVDDPAFGVKKAQIGSMCSGEAGKCLMQLRKARTEKHGHGCGFCRIGAFKAYYAKLVTNPNSSHITSLESERNLQPSRMAEGQPVFNVSEEQYKALQTENAKLKSDYSILQTAHENLKKEAGETASRVAALEQASRKAKIATIITEEVIKDEKKRDETINSLVALNLKDEDFNKAVAPLLEVAKIRQASRSKFQYNGDGNGEEAEPQGDELWFARSIA